MPALPSNVHLPMSRLNCFEMVPAASMNEKWTLLLDVAEDRKSPA
jgi:hypothetical protein